MKRSQPRPRAKASSPARVSAPTARIPARPAPPPAAVPAWWSGAVALAAFAVYLLQTPSVSGDKDSAEFTLVLAFNGVAHPTGYPVYTLLGHLWTRLVHGLGATWAYAASSWSAAGGAVAIYFLHRLALALVPPRERPGRAAQFALALLPVALFAPNPIWTHETTLAEVYSWHLAWVLGTALYCTRLLRALADETEWPPHRLHAHAAAWGALCGLGAAHHATSLFVSLPLSIAVLVVLAARRRLRPAPVAVALVALLVPLASYGVIYWRATHPAVVQWPTLEPGFGALLQHVTGQQYAGNLGRFLPSLVQTAFLRWYVWPFLFPGLVLLVAQAVWVRGLAPRATAVALAAAAAAGTAYAFRYGVVDPSPYFLHPMALGLAAVTPASARLLAGGARVRRGAAAGLAALALTAAVLWFPWTRTNTGRVRLYEDLDRYVHSMWTSIPVDSAFVIWDDDMYYKLREWQLLGHEKPGLFVYHPFSLWQPAPRARFRDRHGFDPAEGIVLQARLPITVGGADSLSTQAVIEIEKRINTVSPLPVIHFDAATGSVRLLRKPPPPGVDSAGRAPERTPAAAPGR